MSFPVYVFVVSFTIRSSTHRVTTLTVVVVIAYVVALSSVSVSGAIVLILEIKRKLILHPAERLHIVVPCRTTSVIREQRVVGPEIQISVTVIRPWIKVLGDVPRAVPVAKVIMAVRRPDK